MDDAASVKADLFRTLIERRMLLPSGVPGVYGRGPSLVGLVERIERLIDGYAQRDGASKVSFPAVLPREVLRRVGYLESFPHLCGSVHAFTGDGRRHAALVERAGEGGDWTEFLAQTEVVLTPAACYPLYPTLTGQLAEGGALFDLTGQCFRHEPSDDPARMQAFQLRENVRAGAPADVLGWREAWIARGQALLEALGLDAKLEVANDPFFGRGGVLMKASQRALELKFELVVPIWSEASPTAVASFNYHQDKFGQAFDIYAHDGSRAHTGCLGFGIDRLALSLLRTHGVDLERWPSSVRARLWA
jgi:seryl-tRNA synthetase